MSVSSIEGWRKLIALALILAFIVIAGYGGFLDKVTDIVKWVVGGFFAGNTVENVMKGYSTKVQSNV